MAEEVEFDENSGVFTFHWTHFTESARITDRKPDSYLRWEWVDGDHFDGEYVSFRIDEPGDDWLDLYIEDFCDADNEKEVRAAWDTQVKRLESIMG